MSAISDVAKKAGVSTATVSRTFSGPYLVNEGTQKRVLEAARQLNFQPRRARVGTRGGKEMAGANAIGFQFFAATPEDTLSSNLFYAPILAGAQAEAAALGWFLLLHTTDRYSLAQELPRMVLERAVGGMLLVGTTEPAILATFAQHIPKIVLVDNRDESGAYESVISDGFEGAFSAARYLIGLGHRRIGFFLSKCDVPAFHTRLRGYRCALLEAGLELEPELIVGERSLDESKGALHSLLTSSYCPTALIAANDLAAFEVMRLCREIGLQIPADLSLIGFDDTAFSAHVAPPLTTVRVDKEGMGRLALRRLVARIKEEGPPFSAEPPVCNQLPVSLIVRDSCRSLT